ncbi:MAG: hypothetical protein IPJ13_22675 [Saprospiraceae bacterium]|nr:hypothetical protein [Saprospiraceae bacterium]
MNGKLTILLIFLIIQVELFCQCDSIEKHFDKKLATMIGYKLMEIVSPDMGFTAEFKILSKNIDINSARIVYEIKFSCEVVNEVLFPSPGKYDICTRIKLNLYNGKTLIELTELNEFGKKSTFDKDIHRSVEESINYRCDDIINGSEILAIFEDYCICLNAKDMCTFLKLKFERKIEDTYSYLTMMQLIPSQWYDNLNGKILASEYKDTTITLKIEMSFKAKTQMIFGEIGQAIFTVIF